ncbi:MAG: protein translocase subunit SecF [Candidatus Cloacimonetes bacterium]|nr:protein translocase subunit SecF [Candidatus Cloacimonadota bacterium]
MRIIKNPNIQFVKYRYWAYAFSIVVLLIGLGGIIFNGLNWSIDFTSGIAATLNLKAKDPNVAPLPIDELRSVLAKNGFPDAEIMYVGDEANSVFQIKIKTTGKGSNISAEARSKLIDIIQSEFPEYVKGRDINKEVIEEIYEVGPKVGSELRTQAFWAVLLALIAMIIYIWFRFELTFGLMGILALFHDVLIIVGIFALTGKEITMQIIAALLTIVGYSINDTIVIFDRIREDLKKNRKDPMPVIFNKSINETLSRTIITGGTTFITSACLFFFGGSVIHDFAFAICLGILFGTYSSIFVASNLVIDLHQITGKEKKTLQHLTKKKK